MSMPTTTITPSTLTSILDSVLDPPDEPASYPDREWVLGFLCTQLLSEACTPVVPPFEERGGLLRDTPGPSTHPALTTWLLREVLDIHRTGWDEAHWRSLISRLISKIKADVDAQAIHEEPSPLGEWVVLPGPRGESDLLAGMSALRVGSPDFAAIREAFPDLGRGLHPDGCRLRLPPIIHEVRKCRGASGAGYFEMAQHMAVALAAWLRVRAALGECPVDETVLSIRHAIAAQGFLGECVFGGLHWENRVAVYAMTCGSLGDEGRRADRCFILHVIGVLDFDSEVIGAAMINLLHWIHVQGQARNVQLTRIMSVLRAEADRRAAADPALPASCDPIDWLASGLADCTGMVLRPIDLPPSLLFSVHAGNECQGQSGIDWFFANDRGRESQHVAEMEEALAARHEDAVIA